MALMVMVALAAVAGLVYTVSLATTGDDEASQALPEYVDRLIPNSGDEVLTQSAVGIDVATGYDAYLIVNGTEVQTEDAGLVKDLGLGLVQYQPGQGKLIESLNPEKNCVTAMIWRQIDGQETAEPFNWCFTAA